MVTRSSKVLDGHIKSTAQQSVQSVTDWWVCKLGSDFEPPEYLMCKYIVHDLTEIQLL